MAPPRLKNSEHNFVYQEVWTAAVGKELVCERETDISYDLYAVAVKRMGNIIGRKLSNVVARIQQGFSNSSMLHVPCGRLP